MKWRQRLGTSDHVGACERVYKASKRGSQTLGSCCRGRSECRCHGWFTERSSGGEGAVAELLPAVEKFRNLLVDPEEKARSARMELSLIKHQEKSFDVTMAAVKKESSSARVECATLRRNRTKFF